MQTHISIFRFVKESSMYVTCYLYEANTLIKYIHYMLWYGLNTPMNYFTLASHFNKVFECFSGRS